MNIVTPFPTSIPLNTANVNTESARRDNLQRETVPKTSNLENSAAESGVGSESDRVRTPGQAPQPVTYERPQPQQQQQQAATETGQNNQDNAEDPSAGRENAESRQQEQQERAEQQELDKLKQRDREVRAHEQAHASTGGQYAGAPSYDFESGPDGRQYAVGGEVSIDIAEEKTPEATLRKMQQVRAAALAPAEPSSQDLRVAAEATQKASDARAEIARDNAEEAKQAYNTAFEVEGATGNNGQTELDDIVQGAGASAPRRSLQEESDPVAEIAGLEMSSADFKQALANRDAGINQRAGRIADFYQQVSIPKDEGFRQSA